MSRISLAVPLAAAALAAATAGCGGGEDGLIEEGSLRDCLAGEQLALEPADLSGSAVLGNASPDFRLVTDEGENVDVVVVGNEQKAARAAADIRGSLQAIGAAGSEVIASRNAIVVLEAKPSAEVRRTVEDCLEA